jgi:serine/threonine-protein phosphatase 2B catalytic subunit
MLLAVLSVCSPEELEDDSFLEDDEADRAIIDEATSPEARAAIVARRQQIKNKIRAVGRMQVMFQHLRYVTTPYRWTYTHVGHIQ